MAIRASACALLVTATLGCGGEEFQSGSGGTSSGGSSSGGSSSGGSANGGTSGSGATGTGGVAGSVNPVGGAGGGAGQSGSGGAGGGVIPGCAPKPNAPLLFHTTLDDSISVQTPITGVGPGTSHGEIGPGICDGAFEIDAQGDFLSYPGAENINLVTGTADFFFKPSSGVNGTRHLLSVPGKFQIVWAQNGDLVVGAGSVVARTIPASSVPLAVGVWTRITVTWKFGATDETVQVYFDGNGAGGTFTPGPINTSPIGEDPLFIGANGENDASHADGAIDDVKIYDGTEEPF